MPEIDELSLVISSSAEQALKSLTSLEEGLSNLSDKLSNLNGFKLNIEISGLDGLGKLSNISKSLNGFETSKFNAVASGLETFTNQINAMPSIETSKIQALNDAFLTISKLGTKKGNLSTENIRKMPMLLQDLATGISSVKVDTTGLNNVIKAIHQLGNKASGQAIQNLPYISAQMSKFVREMNRVGSINVNTDNLANLVNSISRLGYSSVRNAIDVMPQLREEFVRLIEALAKTPDVSQNIVDLTNALANFVSQGSKVGSALNGLRGGVSSFGDVFNKISSGLEKVNSKLDKAINKIFHFGRSMDSAKKSAHSLAYSIGKFYATFFIVIRGIKALVKSMEKAMDYVETFNYFNVAMAKLGEDESIRKGFYKNGQNEGKLQAEGFADGYKSTLNDLTKKMSGFTVGAMGELLPSGSKNLGLDPEVIMAFQARVAGVTNSMGMLSDTSVMTSKALTMLSADLSSLTNTNLADVMDNLNSALIGQTRAVYKYGIDISNASLQEIALAHNIEKKVSAMTQAEKAQLRLIGILEQSKVAWADQILTLNSASNQYRVLKQNISTVARTIGNLFLPIIKTVLPYINAFIKAIQQLLNFLGFKIWGDSWLSDLNEDVNGGIGGDFADDMENAEDAIGGASDKAKELKKTLLGIDEINALQDNSDSGSGSGSGVGGGIDLSGDIGNLLSEYESIWNKAFKDMEDKIDGLVKKITSVAKRLWKPIADAWDNTKDYVISGWEYMTDQISGLISDLGRDFLAVWEQPQTVKILEDIFKIVGNIERVVGTIIEKFREAWNENDRGKKILENIRDIFGIIVGHIESATRKTIEWAKKLDFSPLLESIESFTKKVQPAIDAVAGIIEDFYTEVILKFADWTMGTGMPMLVDTMTKFVEKVNWEKLKKNLKEFWTHLEPFMERVGEGLILFIEDLSQAIADFVNSERFQKILKFIEDWLDSISAEDVCQFLKNLAKAFIEFKVAMLGFKVVGTILGSLLIVKAFVKFFGANGGAGGMQTVTTISKMGDALTKLANGIKLVGAGNTSAIGTLLASLGVVGHYKETFDQMGKNAEWENDLKGLERKLKSAQSEQEKLNLLQEIAVENQRKMQDAKDNSLWSKFTEWSAEVNEKAFKAFADKQIAEGKATGIKYGEGYGQGLAGSAYLTTPAVEKLTDSVNNALNNNQTLLNAKKAGESLDKTYAIGLDTSNASVNSMSKKAQGLTNSFANSNTIVKLAKAGEDIDKTIGESIKSSTNAELASSDKGTKTGSQYVIGLNSSINGMKSTLTSTYKTTSDEALKAGATTVMSFGDAIKTATPTVPPQMQYMANQAVSTFQHELKMTGSESIFTQFGRSNVSEYTNGILKNMATVRTVVQGFATTAIKTFEQNNQKSTWEHFGKDSIDGFIEGFERQAEKAYDKVKRFAEKVEKTLHDSSLQFGSPSKTMEKYGGWTIDGFNNGIDANLDTTSSLITKWSNDIVDHIGDVALNLQVLPDLADFELPKLPDATVSRKVNTQVSNVNTEDNVMRQAFTDALMDVFMATRQTDNSNTDSPTVENIINIDSETLYRAVQKGMQKYNGRYHIVNAF